MPDREGPIVGSVRDIRNLPAKFGDPRHPGRGSHWAVIRGDSGYVGAAGGAKVAIFNRWVIRYSGQNPDGTPRHRFKAYCSWTSDVLLAMVGRGQLKPRVILQGKFKEGKQNIDILGWDEWHFADNVLTLENIYRTEGAKFRPINGQ